MSNTWEKIRSDFYRYTGNADSTTRLLACALTAKYPGFTYSFWLRLASSSNRIISITARLKLRRLKRLYCIDIPAGTSIGYGLYLGHGMGIVINKLTKIGNNVNISHFVAIGSNHKTPATIGDRVYIGPNVSIVEDVKIGNGATIGAGSVVISDIPENATAAGVPCRPLSYNSPAEFILNPWPIL